MADQLVPFQVFFVWADAVRAEAEKLGLDMRVWPHEVYLHEDGTLHSMDYSWAVVDIDPPSDKQWALAHQAMLAAELLRHPIIEPSPALAELLIGRN
jgi:hypothetical protein